MEIRITIPITDGVDRISMMLNLQTPDQMQMKNMNPLQDCCMDIWKKITNHLKAYSTALTYSAWLTYLEPEYIDHEEKLLVLKTQSDFVRQVVRTKYWNLLQDAAADILGPEYEVKILLESVKRKDI